MPGFDGSIRTRRGMLRRFPGAMFHIWPFAAIHGQLDGMAVRAVEGLVLMEKRLDDILAGRDLGEESTGKPKTPASKMASSPGFSFSTSMPKMGWASSLRELTWNRGSRLSLSERIRSIRPSNGPGPSSFG